MLPTISLTRYKTLTIVSSIIILSAVINLLPSFPQQVYYSWFAIVAIVMLINGSRININIIWLLMACVLSLLFNNVPEVFKSWERLLVLVIMLTAIGPTLMSKRISQIQTNLFLIITYAIVIITTMSFIGYILRLPICFNRSGFCGFSTHSMILGSWGGVSALWCMNIFYKVRRKKSKIFWGSILIISILICLLGGSRSALLSMIISSLFYIWFYVKGNIIRFSKYLIAFSIIITASSPIWYPYTERIRQKMEVNEAGGGQFYSREKLWENRLSEFEQNPIFGIGFASIDLKLEGNRVRENGGIEPGSSWLFILSSIGILGLIPILIMTLKPIYRIITTPKQFHISDYTLIIATLLVYRLIIMCAEGFALAAGDFDFLYLWLTVSIALFETSKVEV